MAGNFQVSSKLNDGRIFVVSAETYTDFCTALEAVAGVEESQGLLTEMGKSLIGTAQNIQQATAIVAQAFPGATVDHSAHPVNANTAPSSRACNHGTMTPRSGSGAKGPWKGYFCPSPKGTPDQCSPVFIQRNDPAWNSI
jgi:hypothetical protein